MIEQAPASRQPLSIEDTFLYTITCTHNNKHDWRLPTHKEIAIQSKHKHTQDEAFLYTITCTHNNKYDWRFPTIYEFIYSGFFTNRDVWNIENVNNPFLKTKAKYMTLPIRDIKKATNK